MLRTSYHTHNRYCDGRGEIVEYAEAAIEAGLAALGVTSHSPLPFREEYAMALDEVPAYCSDVLRLREKYAGRLQIHLGLEWDYVPEHLPAMEEMLAPFRFDYLIGSVHFAGTDADGIPSAYDLSQGGFERGLQELFGGAIERMVRAYYARVRSLLSWGQVAIVGHIDRIKMWNRDGRYFREDAPWYREEVERTLQACARAGVIVELNTSGWRHAVRAPYPSPWILRRCLDLEIPLVVTTDAHAPGRVAEFHAEAEALVRDVGCRRLAVLRAGRWTLESY
ncbi:MAG: histidinol-phosphatase [Armatimonadota bacterium]|nr:histidinol-phosphatase [Armatimonadota bacterium]